MAMQREVMACQERADDAQQKQRLLKQQTQRIDRQKQACTEALERYRAMICNELNGEYRQLLETAREELTELYEKNERLDQELIRHEQSIARCLEVSRKNQELQFVSEQIRNSETGLANDAEIIALRHAQECDSD